MLCYSNSVVSESSVRNNYVPIPRHCDTRYALFYAATNGTVVTLTHLLVVTGADFFSRFRQFEGRGTNGKIQIPLPRNFFDF